MYFPAHPLVPAAVLGAGLAAIPLVLAAPAAATTGSLVVSPAADRSAGPLQAAVDAARPGDVIRVHGGTYAGGILIRSSGTATDPIVLQPYGDGQVTLTTSFDAPPCNATSPVQQRTIRFGGGASHWTVQGLRIVGGIIASGKGVAQAQHWLHDAVARGDWRDRRSLPGRMTSDATAARSAPDALGRRVGRDLQPSDGISILDNDISQRGIHLAMARYGVIHGNEIHDTECGTGPGIWAGTLSDGWTITNNHVYRIAPSTWKHYMQEGIRLSDMASYSTVADNLVEDLPGDGRAFNTDVDASWNTFSGNVARNVNIGFNDQMSGWGNEWTHNVVTGYRTNGFQLRALDAPLDQPSYDSSTNGAVITCNTTDGTGPDLEAGAAMNSTFRDNAFVDVDLSSNLRRYWTRANNTWNGGDQPPPAHAASKGSGRSSC